MYFAKLIPSFSRFLLHRNGELIFWLMSGLHPLGLGQCGAPFSVPPFSRCRSFSLQFLSYIFLQCHLSTILQFVSFFLIQHYRPFFFFFFFYPDVCLLPSTTEQRVYQYFRHYRYYYFFIHFLRSRLRCVAFTRIYCGGTGTRVLFNNISQLVI